MPKISAVFALALFLSAFAISAEADCGDPSNPKDPKLVNALPACSYTTTNKSCKVTIDRMNPSTPPTIYVRPTCSVYVDVKNVYPLEHLTLDWKSTTLVIPTDTFRAALTAVSPALGSLAVVGAAGGRAAFICENTPTGCTTARDIYEAQERLKAKLPDIHPYADIKMQIEEIKTALLPPPGGSDHPGPPWENTAAWQDTTYKALKKEVNLLPNTDNIQAKLAANIDTLQKAASTVQEKSDVEKLLTNQKMLDDSIKVLDVAKAKIDDLAEGLKSAAIPDTAPNGILGNAVITDTAPNDQNYQNETWVLNYSNKLLPTAKRVAADALKPEDAFYFGGIADAPNKQPVITLTVQFQATSAIELSTGLMVPFKAYHSYAKGSDASGNAIVQETTTYVVVPMAFVNYRVAEWPTRKQASAFFFTGGVGVNSSTKAVEFSAGTTYSYRSFAVSMLFDIGRDTQLGGGLTSGGSLGKYSAPPTTTTWGVKPAAAVSIRIPLGGGSSTSK
jgi:hypothetical protein